MPRSTPGSTSASGRYQTGRWRVSWTLSARVVSATTVSPTRTRIRLSLGVIATSKLHDAIAASTTEPVGTYTFAILEVESGKMDQFGAMLDGAQGTLPILACWREVTGNPHRIIDLWKGDVGRGGFRPSDEAQNAFFEPLRKVAPREKLIRLHPMPYSPLR